MTEVTRVPLQPIAKGALAKLWIGVGAVALAAAGIAYATLPPHVKVETLKAGTGASPTEADVALINYTGKLPSGKVFDSANGAVLPLQGVIPGFTQALGQMQKGGKYKVHIPSELGYGDKVAGPIPANSDLDFDIELVDFKSRAEIEQQQRLMQQLQQMQGGAPGAAQGAPGAAPPPPEPAPAPAPQQ